MTTVLSQDSQQAPAMPLAGWQALERGSRELPTPLQRGGSSHYRYLLGGSSRFSDGQHAASARIEDLPSTVEVPCWQTKVTGTDKTRRNKRMIAVKVSFTGHNQTQWWDVWLHFMKTVDKSTTTAHTRDFLLPTPGHDYRTYYLRPCSNSKALAWMRRTLYDTSYLGDPNPDRLYLSTPRVSGPDAAYQLGIPPHLRRDMGEWSDDNNTMIYQRNRRKVLIDIWNQLHKAFTEDHQTYVPAHYPESLHGTNVGIAPSPRKPRPAPRDPTTLQVPEAPYAGAQQLRAERRARHTPVTPGLAPYDIRLLTDYVVHNTNVKGHTHWITKARYDNGDYKTVGCGWEFDEDDVEILANKATYYSQVDKMRPCEACWGKVQEPEHWDPPGLYGQDTDTDTDTSTDDDEPDSDDDILLLSNDDMDIDNTPGQSSAQQPDGDATTGTPPT